MGDVDLVKSWFARINLWKRFRFRSGGFMPRGKIYRLQLETPQALTNNFAAERLVNLSSTLKYSIKMAYMKPLDIRFQNYIVLNYDFSVLFMAIMAKLFHLNFKNGLRSVLSTVK